MKHLNENQTDCIDFEARFCCPKSILDMNADLQRRLTVSNQTNLKETEYDNLPDAVSDLRNFTKSIHQKLYGSSIVLVHRWYSPYKGWP